MSRRALCRTAVLPINTSFSPQGTEFKLSRGSTRSVALPELEEHVSRSKGTAYPARISDPSTWVDRHGDYLYRYALMRVRSRELAENVVQETYLAALTGRNSFSGCSSEKTWMVGILKHKIVDQFRKSFREKAVTEIQTDEKQTIDQFYDAVGQPKQYPRGWMPDPEALLHSKEFWEALHECLNRLPERTAAAFMMREFENQSTEEICQALRVTPTNLWVILHRARLQLRMLLEENWFEKGVLT